MIKKLFLIAVLGIIVSGCTKNSEGISKPEIKMITIKKNSDGCDSLSNNCAALKITYPVITNARDNSGFQFINKEIENYLLSPSFQESSYDSLNALVNDFIGSYNEFKNEVPDAPQKWEYNMDSRILLNKNGVLSLSLSEFTYTGGAHPNHSKTYLSFFTDSGLLIPLDEIFKKNYLNSLTDLAEKEFRKQRNLKPDESLKDAGYWFENNVFHLNENYALTEKGLTFYFAPYEIGPYSLGETELTIPYIELKELINVKFNFLYK